MSKFRCNWCLQSMRPFGEQTTADNRKCFLSECLRHIFCEKCVRRVHPKCPFCSRTVRFMEINERMKPKYRMMFLAPDNLLGLLRKVTQFQDRQHQWNFTRMGQSYVRYKQIGGKINQELLKYDEIIRHRSSVAGRLQFILTKATEYRATQRQEKKKKRRKGYESQKFVFRPNEFKDAPPISPSRLQFTSHINSAFINDDQGSSSTSGQRHKYARNS